MSLYMCPCWRYVRVCVCGVWVVLCVFFNTSRMSHSPNIMATQVWKFPRIWIWKIPAHWLRLKVPHLREINTWRNCFPFYAPWASSNIVPSPEHIPSPLTNLLGQQIIGSYQCSFGAHYRLIPWIKDTKSDNTLRAWDTLGWNWWFNVAELENCPMPV